jgi:hypothetical protein
MNIFSDVQDNDGGIRSSSQAADPTSQSRPINKRESSSPAPTHIIHDSFMSTTPAAPAFPSDTGKGREDHAHIFHDSSTPVTPTAAASTLDKGKAREVYPHTVHDSSTSATPTAAVPTLDKGKAREVYPHIVHDSSASATPTAAASTLDKGKAREVYPPILSPPFSNRFEDRHSIVTQPTFPGGFPESISRSIPLGLNTAGFSGTYSTGATAYDLETGRNRARTLSQSSADDTLGSPTSVDSEELLSHAIALSLRNSGEETVDPPALNDSRRRSSESLFPSPSPPVSRRQSRPSGSRTPPSDSDSNPDQPHRSTTVPHQRQSRRSTSPMSDLGDRPSRRSPPPYQRQSHRLPSPTREFHHRTSSHARSPSRRRSGHFHLFDSRSETNERRQMDTTNVDVPSSTLPTPGSTDFLQPNPQLGNLPGLFSQGRAELVIPNNGRQISVEILIKADGYQGLSPFLPMVPSIIRCRGNPVTRKTLLVKQSGQSLLSTVAWMQQL